MSKPGALTAEAAVAAIEGILAALPASELPKLKREVEPDGTVLVWHGGSGWHLGSARRKTMGVWERMPLHYRERAARDCLALEAVYRADLKHLATEEQAS